MGYFPLDLGNIAAGWCGDNAFKFRTGAGPVENAYVGQGIPPNSRFGPTLWDNQAENQTDWRHFPLFLGRTDAPSQNETNDAAAANNNPNPYIMDSQETNDNILY